MRHSLRLPGRQLETLSLPLSHRYTLESDAVWVAPEEAVRDALDESRLVELVLPLEQQGGSVGLCTNASLAPSLALEGFCETLREVAANLVGGR
ncbi:hypothetical protein DFO68_10845 [Halomonas ventosae]|uniref:LysR substrate binding domain-containing protein n=1 Tax=Halomonas ventosae TaxID=229007 RepID=A0A4R6HGE5_9GAMM|nr:hypothetical protein DFO68_10845 [Halomonas ventosae]